MFFKLLLMFTLVPLLELVLLLRINQAVGIWYTMLLVIMTGVLGAWLAKSEGMSIIKRIRYEMSEGRMPGDELVNGLCVLVGGAMLLTPGIITDTAGFLLIFPVTRSLIKSLIKNKMRHMINDGQSRVYYHKDE